MNTMKESVRIELEALLQKLDEWKGSFSGEFDDEQDTFLVQKALGISEFMKAVALRERELETIGLCEIVAIKATELDERESEEWENYEESRSQEYWDDKTHLNATEISILLGLSRSGTAANKFLESHGYQVRGSNGWVATPKASAFAEQQNMEEGKQPYVRWKKEIIEELEPLVRA